MSIENRKFLIIPQLTPYFLDKPVFWFKKNKNKLRVLSKKAWGKNQIIVLEKDQLINPLEILRHITEFNYQKTQHALQHGEFAHRGAIIDIFPLGNRKPWRLEFIGNKIEKIYQFTPKKGAWFNSRPLLKNKKLLQQHLKPGDYLVHLDHGIGRFVGFDEPQVGTGQCPVPTTPERYFILKYAQGDKLYVPTALSHKLTLYLGFRQPIVHRLGGSLWPRTKKEIAQSTLELARELLKIYAQRETMTGLSYGPDTAQDQELASDFVYLETHDQKKAILDIKKDMESPYKMDRLICGDVGFGKTEVALRTAFKAVLSGKQVALLAPTTILAQQHYWTFKKRLDRFAVNSTLLSRLQNRVQQKRIVQKIGQGQIDLVIGTHRLLSKDVNFKNLSLVIIDEEQRFGVKQKEKFKKIRANIDVLSLSATPIPRTLYLSLGGLRAISLIQTPPPGRLPIKTFIQPYNTRLIKQVIKQELDRQGQVYFLHNRVQTIELARKRLQEILPQAKIGIIHGQLPENQLIEIMHRFRQGKIQVLLATTIIENGIDFPNVNTLIVEDATRLGLAQAYQIRGRIGRSSFQAFAYFFYRTKNLTDIAKKRLEALQDAEALGSGYEIAKRDLEIRGAGNILGREQAGHINALGLNLYCQMLNEAVRKLKKISQNPC